MSMMSEMAPHEQRQRLRVQREQLHKAQLLATRSDQHVAQAAEYNERLARKVSRVRRQIDAVDGEYSALLSQPPGDMPGDTASAEREGGQYLQEERQQLPDELDSWVREASGKVSATQERLRNDSKREAPVHYPRVADPANIRATHSSRAQRSLGLGRRSANRSHLDKLSSSELRAMSEKELFEKLRDDAERAKAAERLARRPRWREATKARVMDDTASPTAARKGKPVPVSAEGEPPLPATQVKRQLQHDIEYTKGLRRRPGAKQPGTRFVPRSYTGTSGAGLWAVEQYTLRPDQWWSPPDAVAERLKEAAGSPIPNSEASAPADSERTQGRDKTAEKEEWLEKFERLADKFALLAQRQREALADAIHVKADVEAKEAAEEVERILGSIKVLRGRAEEAGADGDVDGAMAMMDQAKDLEVKLAAQRREHQRKQDDYHDNAVSLRNTVAEVRGTTGHLRDVEELMEFAQELGILRDLRGMDELATVRRWRGECAMADWMEMYSEWEQWEDAGRLNLAIDALMPLLNGPTATRQCVPEELLPAMEKRLVVLKGHDFLKRFEPPVPRLSLPSALHDISESETEPSGPVGAAAVDDQPNSHDESDSTSMMGQNTHGIGEATLATLQKEYPNVAVQIPTWAAAEWSQDEARLYLETQGMIEPARKLSSEDADASDSLPNHVDNTISSVGFGSTQLRQSTVAEMKARFASTLAASNDLLEELVPAKQNKAERWRIDKNKQKRVFQSSVAYSKQLKKAMQIAQGDAQKQEAAAAAIEATKSQECSGPGLLPPDEKLVGVLMRARPQLKQLWRDVIADESSVSINAAELGRMLSEGLNVHDFAPAVLAHLMHWLGAGGILDEGWHSIPFTQFFKRLQLLADGNLVRTSGKGATALPPVRRKQHVRSGKKATKPLHGRRSAPPVL